LGTLYPALLLMGALGYAGHRVPRWLTPAALVLGAGRGLAQYAGLFVLAHGASLVVETGVVLGAAIVVARARLRAPLTASQRLLPLALLGVAGLELASALSMIGGGALPSQLVTAWGASASLLLAIQLAAWVAVARRDLERAREMLEARVAEQTERYRLVSELSSDLSFAYRVQPGLDVAAEWVTSAQGRITGYTPGELDGIGWLSLVPAEDRQKTQAELVQMLAGELDETQLRIITKGGEERFLHVRVKVVGHEPDGSIRLVGSGQDVTDRVRAEQERRRLDRHLRDMQRLESLGRLAGGIAHDFNNALTVILGNTRLALEGVEPGSEDERRLSRTRSAAEFAAGLTDQILTYSGRAVVTLEPLDLSSVVRETTELLHASLRGRATLETHLPGGLPPVEGDVTQIRQVLVNLVTNASEALGEEGGVIRVRTGARGLGEHELADTWGSLDPEPGHYTLLEVSDSGRGLDRATQSRIFEPFFTTRSTGRGMGLAAVLGIVRSHAGVIRVESVVGEGTTIQVLLPRTERAVVPTPPKEPVPAVARGHVLVVDDDDAVLEVAASFLERAGFDVLTAGGGLAALDLLRDFEVQVDAVVLDLVMPDLSTEEALRGLRKLRPELPVVLTSGYDREQAIRRLSTGEVSNFLRKPYGPEELVAVVQGAMGTRAP
jgi:PAS domain S-box-containing protein